MKINLLNPIYSQTDSPKMIRDCLSFDKTIWRKSQHRKIAKDIKIYKINREGYFYTGLIPKIQEYCKQNNIPLEITKSPEYVELIESIPIDRIRTLPGITLRDDQNRLVDAALKHKRGVIVSPTGSGKSILIFQLISYLNTKTLILVPKLDLLRQTVSELKRFGFNSIAALGEGNKEINGEDIIVSTIQTFVKLDLGHLIDYFNCIVLDESHLAVRNMATIEQIFSKLIAPYRIGFTATPPNTLEQEIVLCGLLGPVIDQVTINEAKEMNILSEVEIKIIPVPKCKTIINLKTYNEIYQEAIVEYSLRNKIICNEVVNLVDEGRTVLIFINKIEHGERLYDLLIKENIGLSFVRGDVSSEERDRLKKMINKGDIDVVISSSVWTEGVNIPNLGAVVLASAGKSEIRLLQSIGRGLRRTNTKDKAIIVDFCDQGKYISEHFCGRYEVYKNMEFV